MTAEEFRAWLERRGLSDADAAPFLRAKRHEVWRWRTGKRKMPDRVEKIVELMDEVRRLQREPEEAKMHFYSGSWEDQDMHGKTRTACSRYEFAHHVTETPEEVGCPDCVVEVGALRRAAKDARWKRSYGGPKVLP